MAILAGVSAISILLLAQGDSTPFADGTSTTSTTLTGSTTSSTPAVTTTVPFSETLQAVLPDVDGTLIAAVGQGSIRLVTWPGTRQKTIVPIPMWTGPEIEFDRSGHDMAFLGPAEAGEDSALYVGTTDAWHPLAVSANSFRWHARDAGRIAWTGDRLLCHGQVHPRGGFRSLRCLLDIEGRLLGFDDTGYLLAMDPGIIVRLDPEGAELGRTEGDDALIGTDGRILIVSTDTETRAPVAKFSVADPDLSRVTQLDWAPETAVGEYGFVAWSPASSPPEIAFLVSLGDDRWQLQRWSIRGKLLASPNLAGRYWNVEWDWLGRYLLSPGVNEQGDSIIHIYDTDTREHFELGATDWVQDVHLVRDVNAPYRFDLTSVMRGQPVK